MDADEREIFHFLKTWGSEFIGAKEICRRAGGKKKFHENNDWAKPILVRMEERGVLESDSTGRYRIKHIARKDKAKRWVSPEIAKILLENGVQPEETGEGGTGDVAPDEYYDQL